MQSGHRPKGRRLLFEFCARTPERAMRRGLLIVALGIGCKPSCEVKDLLLGVCGQGLKQCNDISQIVHDSLSLGRRPCRFGAKRDYTEFCNQKLRKYREVKRCFAEPVSEDPREFDLLQLVWRSRSVSGRKVRDQGAQSAAAQVRKLEHRACCGRAERLTEPTRDRALPELARFVPAFLRRKRKRSARQ